jgi:hypothetical protein
MTMSNFICLTEEQANEIHMMLGSLVEYLKRDKQFEEALSIMEFREIIQVRIRSHHKEAEE